MGACWGQHGWVVVYQIDERMYVGVEHWDRKSKKINVFDKEGFNLRGSIWLALIMMKLIAQGFLQKNWLAYFYQHLTQFD